MSSPAIPHPSGPSRPLPRQAVAQTGRQRTTCRLWPILPLMAISLAGCMSMHRFEYTQSHMGLLVHIICYSPDKAQADAAAQAAFARLADIDRLASDYRPDSELNRLNQSAGTGRPIPISADLWAILDRARYWSQQTDGAFDVTVGAAVKLWRQARRTGRMPPADRLAQARRACGFTHLHLDHSDRSARLDMPAMRLDLGAIAKGYALDRAMDALAGHGIRRACIDAGGDLVLGQPPPGRPGWRVRLMPVVPAEPAERSVEPVYVTVSQCAVATSGDAFRHVVIDGRRYSHIVDPHTGLGLTRPIGASVIAPTAIDADALATAVCVMGPQRGLALCNQLPRVHAMLVTQDDGGKTTAFFSPGFPADSPTGR